MTERGIRRRAWPDVPTLLFSLTLLLSATLMFSMQPMAGKMLLPLAGGSPSGWLVAMACFQLLLLGGYAPGAAWTDDYANLLAVLRVF